MLLCKPKERARDALDEFFRSIGRRVYVSSELVTYSPGEARFCPDILAVLDVEPHERMSWIVSKEGKGLDLVVEIHVGGDAVKDFETNVVRYARLSIPEYFVFDRPRGRIVGYRLPAPGTSYEATGTSYERIVPQAGRLPSQVLGLDLTVEGGMLRFYHGTAPLLFMDELVGKLNSMVAELVDARDQALRRAEDEARRAEDEARRAEDEARRAEALAAEVERLKAELERIRRDR